MTTAQLILIAGPCRSGTGGDRDLVARNLARPEQAAWPVFDLGHVPVIGERVALPVLRVAAEAGADADVATARRRGIPVCSDVAEVPPAPDRAV